jgi:hypothetical protein
MTGRDIPHAGEKVKNNPAAKSNETNHFLFLLSILPPLFMFQKTLVNFRYLSILALIFLERFAKITWNQGIVRSSSPLNSRKLNVQERVWLRTLCIPGIKK